MRQIIIAYWSGSGNTEEMASVIARGVKGAGKEAKVVSVDDINASELKNLLPERQLACLVPMDGETANGCVTGWNRCKMLVLENFSKSTLLN